MKRHSKFIRIRMSEGWNNETFGCFEDIQTCKLYTLKIKLYFYIFNIMLVVKWQYGVISLLEGFLSFSGAYGYFCGLCMYFQNVSRLQENVGKHAALICCCPLCAVGTLKTDTRKKYNIEVGNIIFWVRVAGLIK